MVSMSHQPTPYPLSRNMNSNQFDDSDFPLFPEHQLYSQDLFAINSNIQNFSMDSAIAPYNYPRTSHESFPPVSDFASTPMYPTNSQSYAKQSPTLYPLGSPELRAPASNLSTASGASATSSAIGSPYSSHGQAATATTAEWQNHGLGVVPSIVGDFGYAEYNFGASGMEEFAFTDLSKPHGYVGECATISASAPRAHTSVSSSTSSSISNFNRTRLEDLDGLNSYGGTPKLTQSPLSIASPLACGNDIPRFKSPATPTLPPFSLSFRRSSSQPFGNHVFCDSSTAGQARDLKSSPSFLKKQPFTPSRSNSASSLPTYYPSPFFSQSSGHFVAPLESSYPSILNAYASPQAPSPMPNVHDVSGYQQQIYSHPQSPTPSHNSSSSRHIKQGSQSPFLHNSYNTYPYPPPARRMSVASQQSYTSLDGSFDSDDSKRGRCPNPECGKVFKDLKAHMLTHQNERPEKCPIQTCDYHTKGFARKYDKNRHTLTHYKGTMVCGFCPGSGSAAEKSFNRADVFKRHLTSVHAVEQTPPNSRKKTAGGLNAGKKLAGYAADATGKCSTCSATFNNAQDFYEHLDDCVLRIVQQEDPSEAINARRLAEVENDPAVLETLRANALPTTTINHYSADEEDDGDEYDDVDDDDYTGRSKIARRGNKSRVGSNGAIQKSRVMTHSKGGVALPSKGRKKRKDYPTSWGCAASQMKMKKRVMCAFDGSHRLWKDDMMLSSDYDVRIPLADGKSYVTDLDIQTLKRSEAFHNATAEEKGDYSSDEDDNMDLVKLMEIKTEEN